MEHLFERNLSKEEIEYVMNTLMINLSLIRVGVKKLGIPGAESLPVKENQSENEKFGALS